MKLRKGEIVSSILVLLSIAAAFYYYPKLPDEIASHWNASGQVDGYMSRFWGVSLLPLILIGMLCLFIVIPRIDPQKTNIEKFRTYFDRYIVVLFLFLIYIYLLTIYWNLGYSFDLVRFLVPAFSILFFCTGILIAHAEPNWTIGIRTPWTLSHPEVWKQTHHLGGRVFKVAAVIGLIGMFVPEYAFLCIIIPVLGAALVMMVYSYIAYRRLVK